MPVVRRIFFKKQESWNFQGLYGQADKALSWLRREEEEFATEVGLIVIDDDPTMITMMIF